MNRGQFFILTVVLVSVLIAAVAENYFFELEAKRSFNRIESNYALMENIKTELAIVTMMDPMNSTRIKNFTLYIANESKKANIKANITTRLLP
ncbi:hypothetical protein DRN74_00055 [Candidatus Micrarchaeota archaeon]|nr:MAG: hypothetical protein DRN74_00055 [Candidatus Micrarchaeota archaeon]